MCLAAGQLSDHIGAKLLYPGLCDSVKAIMIADKGYDSDDDRAALKAGGITPCIPPRTGRKAPASFCNIQYKQRHKVENMFALLKDRRRIATPYDRRADVFMVILTGARIDRLMAMPVKPSASSSSRQADNPTSVVIPQPWNASFRRRSKSSRRDPSTGSPAGFAICRAPKCAQDIGSHHRTNDQSHQSQSPAASCSWRPTTPVSSPVRRFR